MMGKMAERYRQQADHHRHNWVEKGYEIRVEQARQQERVEAASDIEKLEARIAELEASLAAAVKEVGEQGRLRGEAEGKLEGAELPGIVDGWRERVKELEAKNARLGARTEAAEAKVDRLTVELNSKPVFKPELDRHAPPPFKVMGTTFNGVYGLYDANRDLVLTAENNERLCSVAEWMNAYAAENVRLTAELAEAKAETKPDASVDILLACSDAKMALLKAHGYNHNLPAIKALTNAINVLGNPKPKPEASGDWREHEAVLSMEEYANAVVPYTLQNHWGAVLDALPAIIDSECAKAVAQAVEDRHEWACKIVDNFTAYESSGYFQPNCQYTVSGKTLNALTGKGESA